MYLYVERIRDFFGLCAIQIYFLLTYLLTYIKGLFYTELCSQPGENLATFLDVFSRKLSELIILVVSHGDCVAGRG